MIPSKFPEANRLLKKPPDMNEECLTLPVWTDDYMCVSMWRPTWRERLSLLLFGKLWLYVVTGKGTQPPVAVVIQKKVFGNPKGEGW